MKLTRQHVLLGLLLTVLIAALYASMGSGGSAGGGGGDAAENRPLALGQMPPSIRSPRDTVRPGAPVAGRNLFDYGRVPPPPPPVAAPRPVRTTPVIKPPVRNADLVAPPRPPPPAPSLPTPPPINFTFLGYMGPQNGLIGVFSVRTPEGDEIVLAGEGEVLAEKFRIHKISYEEVEIGYLQDTFSNERKILTMGGRS